MPSLKTEVRHSLGQEIALERLKAFLDGIQRRYAGQVSQLKGDWIENSLQYSFSVMGLEIRGTLLVLEELARVDSQIPFAALAFRGRIEQEMRAELTKALESAPEV